MRGLWEPLAYVGKTLIINRASRSHARKVYFIVLFRGSFLTLFSVGFLTGFGYPLAHLFRSKAGKTEVRNDLRRAWKRGPKKV